MTLWPRPLPHSEADRYAAGMATGSDIRRLRVPDELWSLYTEVVGDAGRSADLKAYIAWRVDHPDEPLPGTRRPPVRRSRPTTTDAG